jgi:GNAT superfamily N-acetyltransferase
LRIVVDPFPSEAQLDALMALAREGEPAGGWARVLEQSLVHVGAYEGDRLIGFVNVAWNGGTHGFLLDTTVAPEFQRAGLGRRIVGVAAETAWARGARWLQVDCEERLTGFYAGCRFRPTAARLINLTGARE